MGVSRIRSALITKTSTQPTEIDKSYGNTNQFIVYIDENDTVDLDYDYYHEAAVVDESDKFQVIMKGTVGILKSTIQ